MRRLDLPPLWLLLAWALARLDLWGLSFGGAWADFAAGLGIGGGLLLILLAVVQMRQHRTAVLPHWEASMLLTSGVFRRSRNPIYVGMALTLLGWILWLDEPLALILVPVFVWIIERRFVLPEEAMLRRRFGPSFSRYEAATRRWL